MLAYLNGKLEYFGGDKSDRSTPQTTHWELDLNNTAAGWVTKAPLPIAADHVGHAVINGQIYAIGGEHGHHPVGQNSLVSPYVQHNYLFRYDQASDTWTRLANLPIATSHFEGGTLTINNKIVIMGGLVGGSTTHNRIQVYDPATNKWTLLKTNMPFSGDGVVSGYYGGRIYLTNGFHQAPAPQGNFTTAYWGNVSGDPRRESAATVRGHHPFTARDRHPEAALLRGISDRSHAHFPSRDPSASERSSFGMTAGETRQDAHYAHAI